MDDKLNIPDPWSLDNAQLADIFRKYYPDSQRKFCIERLLNPSNFSRFLVGKKHSPASRDAIIEWIHDKQGIIPAVDYCAATTSTVEEVEDEKDFDGKTEELIVFIDGDNSIGLLRFLHSHRSIYSRIHVVVAIKIGTRSVIAEYYEKKSWVTILFSDTDCRDSADISLTIRSTVMHLRIPSDVPFVFVSADHFINEVISKLSRLSPPRTFVATNQRSCLQVVSDLLTKTI